MASRKARKAFVFDEGRDEINVFVPTEEGGKMSQVSLECNRVTFCDGDNVLDFSWCADAKEKVSDLPQCDVFDWPNDGAWCSVSIDYIHMARSKLVPPLEQIMPFLDFYALARRGERCCLTSGSEAMVRTKLTRERSGDFVVKIARGAFSSRLVIPQERTTWLMERFSLLADFVSSCYWADDCEARPKWPPLMLDGENQDDSSSSSSSDSSSSGGEEEDDEQE